MVAPGHKVVDRLKHLPYVSAMTDHILDATGRQPCVRGAQRGQGL